MSAPQTLLLDAVEPGMEFGEVVYGPLTRADIVRYAGASGDFNPIHIDEDYARAAGAPGVFAMGMLPAGYLAHALSDWIGGPQRLRRFRVRFSVRVWPGDELVCSGRVEHVEGELVTLALEVRRRGPGPEGANVPEEEVAVVGDADVSLPV
jgi:acyl dehydratase